MNRASRLTCSRSAFTLIELMVACAVFVMLTALLVQLFGAVTNSSSASQRRVEVLKQAIGALDRIGYDLRSAIRTGGMDLFVDKQTGNDALAFIAPVNSVNALADSRQISIVRYSIDSQAAGAPDFGSWSGLPALSRTVRPFEWTAKVGDLLPLTSQKISDNTRGFDTQQISPGVIRCEICFQLWNGSIVPDPPSDWKDVRALILGVVVIDRKAALTLSSEERAALSKHFDDPRTDNQRPSEIWRPSLDTLPQPTRETLRIYEQTIPI